MVQSGCPTQTAKDRNDNEGEDAPPPLRGRGYTAGFVKLARGPKEKGALDPLTFFSKAIEESLVQFGSPRTVPGTDKNVGPFKSPTSERICWNYGSKVDQPRVLTLDVKPLQGR